MALKEIVSFHVVLAIFFGILGYISFSLLAENNILEIKTLINDYDHVMAEQEKAGIIMIFLNNISFFSIVCIFPLINIIYMIVQFFNIGTYVYQIKELDFLQQFNLLYRHSIFEIIALIISIYISYSLLKMANNYLKNTGDSFPYRRTFKKVAIAYVLILFLTLVGALLEGNVRVLV